MGHGIVGGEVDIVDGGLENLTTARRQITRREIGTGMLQAGKQSS